MKFKKITHASLCIIIVIFTLCLVSCKIDPSRLLKIYYTDEYITGELIYTEPMVNEVIGLPVISNKEITSITIIDVLGENIDDLIVEIEDVPSQNYYYGDFVYKNIKLRIQAYEMIDEINITKINFEISANDSVVQVVLPFALTIKYDDSIFKLSTFCSLKMVSLPPSLSDPNHFFAIRPNYNMKINYLDNNIINSIKDIAVGISSSNDYNEVNKTTLVTYEGNELNIDVLSNYNIYFNINYQFEESNYLNILFPVKGNIELNNNEVYDILIMNVINLMSDNNVIKNYIEKNFIEGLE